MKGTSVPKNQNEAMDISFEETLVKAFEVEPKTVALGITVLKDFAVGNLKINESYAVAVPSELTQLVHLAREKGEHQRFLIRLLTHFSPGVERDFDRLIKELGTALEKLESEQRLIKLEEEDERISNALEGFFESDDFYVSMSTAKNFLRKYYAKLITFSKAKMQPIIERTGETLTELGHYILSLQIPDRINQVLDAKRKFAEQIFEPIGGNNARFFIGIALSVAGLCSANPVIGVAGVVMTFTDP